MLTVVVLTKNEEKNIVDVIENAHKVSDEVLIIDSGSTDKTVELAEANGARVAYRAWDNDFSAQRNFALQHVQTEWVLYLDADERINDELAEDIIRELNNPRNAMFRLIRRNSAFGRDFKYGVLAPDSVVRMFPKDLVEWKGKVHEGVKSELPTLKLNGYIKHYTYKDWHQYFNKFNQYTTIWAENAYENNKKVSFFSCFGHALFGFIKMGIFKKGIFDGWLGLVLTINQFNYNLVKYVKLIDLYRKDTDRKNTSSGK